MSEKKPTKQRKKQPQVVAVVTPAGVTGSLSGTQRPLIAYLPVRTAQLEQETPMSQIQYSHGTAGEPVPFDQMDENVSYLGTGSTTGTVVVEKLPASSSAGVEEDVEHLGSLDIIPPPSQQQSMWQAKNRRGGLCRAIIPRS